MHGNKLNLFGYCCLIIFLIVSCVCAKAQDSHDITGVSKITHYTKEDYNIETQFWAMAEDDDGIIYFGTNWGISVLNGQEWTNIKLPNGSDVRAVHHTKDNRIFIGGYNEIGEVKRDIYGRFYYESIINVISDDEDDFGLVWQIISLDNLLLFRSFTTLILLEENKATVIPTNDIFWSLDVLENNVYVTSNDGVHLLNPVSTTLELIVESDSYSRERIVAILPYQDDHAMIFSRQGNSYLFNTKNGSVVFDRPHIDSQEGDQIFCATRSLNGHYLLGTINSYLKYYYPSEPNRSESRTDLQDKTVLNIYEAKNGSIWTLLNRGVDFIDNTFPGTTIFTNASIYDTEFYNNRLFVATNQGAFVSPELSINNPLSTADFKLLPGLEAQTWSIQLINETLFFGHDNGAFYLDENMEPIHISGTYGIWKIIPVRGYENKLLACGYDGLFLIEKINNEYRTIQKVENFEESARDIMPGQSTGEFWICHGIKGVYHIKLNSELTNVISREHFTDKNGLPTTYGINVSNYNGRNIFLTSYGPYIYSDSLNQFMPYQELQAIFSSDNLVTNITQYKETVWFVRSNSMGFYSLSSPNNLNEDLFTSLKGTFITSMEHLNPINSQTIMVGTNTGLYLFKHISPNTTTNIPTLISSVSFKDSADSTHIKEINPTETPIFEHDINSLQFSYAAPLLNSNKDVQYRYKLENFDKTWSDWTTSNTKGYSYLKPGNYKFVVEAKDILNTRTNLASYQFVISPPWYQTSTALILFGFLLSLVMVGIILIIRKRYKKSLEEHDELRRILELELEHVQLERENEIILKDNSMLEDSIKYKSKELANYTLQLAKNQDLLIEVKDTLNEIKIGAKLDKTKDRIRALARRISTNLDKEEHLKIFDTNFEKVHQSFFNELKSKYPDLTLKELRLCGFVKMNMTNKEIASVLNISLRGVETARYRLRKHLSLDHDINFVEFLDKLSTGDGPPPSQH